MSLIALIAAAFAQEQVVIPFALDVERYHPHTDSFGYAVTESSTTLGHLQVGVGFYGMASFDSLVLLDADGNRIIGPPPKNPDGLLDLRSTVDLQLGFGLGNIFALMADVPVVAWQSGFEPAGFGSPEAINDLNGSGIGDVRVTPKLTLLEIEEGVSPIGVALLNTLTLPTGSPNSFIGEGGLTTIPMAVLEAADGSVHKGDYQVRGAINAGARIKEPDTFRDLTFGTEFVWRAALGAKPHDIIEVGADIQGSVSGNRVALAPVEVLPWLKFMGGPATIGGGVGVGLNPGVGAPDFRVFGGATLAPSFDPMLLDRDKDGIPNKYDACINIPEDHDGFEDQDGCPEDDNDRDGIFDVNDACPNEPEDFDYFEDQDGCPDYDNDKDTIPDVADACPLVPEVFNGVADHDGCPDEVDTDRDGYVDSADACPLDPEDFDGFQDQDGCPELDNDQDGLLDPVDQCPFDPETRNGYLDEDGCPDNAPSRVVVEKEKIVITEKIFFEYNKAVIQSLSFELLDEVARVIQEHPNITLIQVEGHTDSDGSDSYNLKLSQARAEAVVEYLVRAGVDAQRLVAKGYGETVPIDTNATTEGKAKNRRVEFTILDKANDGKTGNSWEL